LDVLQVLNEIQAAQQSWAGQGIVVAPAAVFVLPSGEALFVYVDAGIDMEVAFEVRAEEGTLGEGCTTGGGGGVT
jgi:hypothetical protein